MELYKKIFLTITGAGMIVSCAPLSNITKPVSAKVVKITKYYYLDQNGDGAVDNCLFIGNKSNNNQCYFRDYIQVGDTLKFRAANKRLINLSADNVMRNVVLDSVNNRSADDLEILYHYNQVCNKMGRSRQR